MRIKFIVFTINQLELSDQLECKCMMHAVTRKTSHKNSTKSNKQRETGTYFDISKHVSGDEREHFTIP